MIILWCASSGCICGFFDRGTVCSTCSSGTDPALALITDTLKLLPNMHKFDVTTLKWPLSFDHFDVTTLIWPFSYDQSDVTTLIWPHWCDPIFALRACAGPLQKVQSSPWISWWVNHRPLNFSEFLNIILILNCSAERLIGEFYSRQPGFTLAMYIITWERYSLMITNRL